MYNILISEQYFRVSSIMHVGQYYNCSYNIVMCGNIFFSFHLCNKYNHIIVCYQEYTLDIIMIIVSLKGHWDLKLGIGIA